MYSISGVGDRQQVGGQAAHLLRHLQRRHPVLDQRLVDVEVEEADLGVGHLADRLGVDPDELQEGDQREARVEHLGAVPHRPQVLLVQPALPTHRGAEQRHQPLDQLGLEPGPLGGLLPAVAPLGDPEQVLGVAEGELAPPGGLLDRLQRVAALAHPRHHPGLGRRGPGPAAVRDRDDPLLGPALQGRRRDAGDPARLGERDLALSCSFSRAPSDASQLQTQATGSVDPVACGLSARCVGQRRRSASQVRSPRPSRQETRDGGPTYGPSLFRLR